MTRIGTRRAIERETSRSARLSKSCRRAAVGVALHNRRLSVAAGVFVVGILMSECSSSKPSPPPPHATQLWGDMKPVVSVKDLMRDMLDPLADNIFNSVSVTVDTNGTREKLPKTEEDWEKIRTGGVAMAEGAYLLKVRRPFAPPGDENNSTGPDAVELSPAQIMAKVERDALGRRRKPGPGM
jgi:hypothetical protein